MKLFMNSTMQSKTVKAPRLVRDDASTYQLERDKPQV